MWRHPLFGKDFKKGERGSAWGRYRVALSLHAPEKLGKGEFSVASFSTAVGLSKSTVQYPPFDGLAGDAGDRSSDGLSCGVLDGARGGGDLFFYIVAPPGFSS